MTKRAASPAVRPTVVEFCMRRVGANIEFDFARYLNDALWMTAVLVKSVFQSLGAVDKRAAKRAPLFAGNPVTGPISADKDDPRGRATRRQLEQLNHHVLR